MSIFKLIVSLFFIFPAFALAEDEAATDAGSGLVNGTKEFISDAASDVKKFFAGALEADPAESVSNCTLGEGATGQPVCKQLTAVAKKLASAVVQAPDPRGITTVPFTLLSAEDIKALQSAISSYETKVESCHKNQLLASKVCIASKNGELQDTMSAITAASAIGSSSSAQIACTAMGKTLGMASAALTAYQSACTAAKSVCLPSCYGANSALGTFQKVIDKTVINPKIKAYAAANPQFGSQLLSQAEMTLEGAKADLWSILSKDINAKDFSTTAGKLSVCTNKYGQLIASAGTGIKGLLDAKKSADNCASNTSGVASMNLDQKCKISEYSNTQECICHLSPRTPGCANSLEKIGGEGSQGLSIGGASQVDTQNKKLGLSASDLRGPSAADLNEKVGTGGGGAGGMPSAGGLGSSTAGGGGGAGDSGGSAAAFPGTYSYDDSGSGGGGGWGGGGGGSWGTDGLGTGDGLEAYLPEGEKDPNALSASSDEPTYVTPEGGKTNFEKVRQIYGEVRSTLLDK